MSESANSGSLLPENDNTTPSNSPAEPKEKTTRLLPSEKRMLYAIVLVSGMGELAYNMVNTSALPVFVKDIHLSTVWISYLVAAFLLAEGILKSPMGLLSDHTGRKPIILLAPCISMFTALATVHLHNPILLLILRLLDGVAAAALWPATFSLIADRIPEERRAVGMSYFNMAYLVGVALGPAISGHLDDQFHTPRATFYAAAVLFAIMLAVAVFLLPGGRAVHHEDGEAVNLKTFWSMLNAMPLLLGTVFLLFGGIGLIIPYVKLFSMERYGLSESSFGNMLIAPALLIAALSAPLGGMGDRIGRPLAVRVGLAICTAAFWALILFTSRWTLLIMGTLIGVGFVTAFPSFIAIVTMHCPSRLRGSAVGAIGTAQGVGALLGVVAGGKLWEMRSFALGPFMVVKHELPFVGCAVLVTLALAALLPRQSMKLSA